MNDSPLVDAHVHIWDPRVLDYPWLGAQPRLNAPVLPVEIDRAAHAGAMVFVQAAARPEQAVREVDWVLSQDWPELAGIVADARLDGPELPDLLARYREVAEVVGVRHILQDRPDGATDTPELAAGLATVGAQGFTFDATVRSEQLRELARLHGRAPGTVLILDHLGNPPVPAGYASTRAAQWRDGIHRVAESDTAVVKLSGVPWTPESRPYFEAAVEAFGVERAILGSDFPVTVPGKRRWDEVADSLAPTVETRHALRWRTAAQTYGIDPTPERTPS